MHFFDVTKQLLTSIPHRTTAVLLLAGDDVRGDLAAGATSPCYSPCLNPAPPTRLHNPGRTPMEGAAHPPWHRRGGGAGRAALRGNPPPQPHRRGHTGAERRLGPPRLLPRGGLACCRREARVWPRAALHEAGEYRHPDVRHSMRRPRV